MNVKLKWSYLLSICTITGLTIAQIVRGVYYTGDTVSHLQDAFNGKLFTTFIQASSSWPPLVPLTFNVLSYTGATPTQVLSIFTISVFVFTLGVVYMLSRLIGYSRVIALVITVLLLFGSVSRLLFLSALSESLFILLLFTSTYSYLKSLQDQNSRYTYLWFMLFIISCSLLPLTRYIGLYLIPFTVIMIVYFFKKKEKKNTFEVLFNIFSSLVVVLLPIVLYFLKNKVATGNYMPPLHTQAVDLTFFPIMTSYIIQIGYENVFIIFGLVLMYSMFGVKLTNMQSMYWVLLGYFISYLVGLSISKNLVYFQRESFMLDHFPSRYIATIYPLFGILALYVLPYFRIPKLTHSYTSYIQSFAPFIVVTALLFINGNHFLTEKSADSSAVPGAENTKEVREFCTVGNTQYILVQNTSSNHIARSLRFICNNPVVLPVVGYANLKKNEIVFSPYQLPKKDFKIISKYTGFFNTYTVFAYQKLNNMPFNISDVTQSITILE